MHRRVQSPDASLGGSYRVGWRPAEYQGGVDVGNQVMGIVAPHCTVVLEILRGPVSSARSPMCDPVLALLRSSVPLLARSVRSGFELAVDLAHISKEPFDCGQKSNGIDLSDLELSNIPIVEQWC